MRIAFILLIGCMNAAALLPHKDPGWKRISRPDIDVYDIAYSGSGTIFAFTDGPRVHVLETENYNEVVVYEEHSMDVYSISISHDDTRILSAGKLRIEDSSVIVPLSDITQNAFICKFT